MEKKKKGVVLNTSLKVANEYVNGSQTGGQGPKGALFFLLYVTVAQNGGSSDNLPWDVYSRAPAVLNFTWGPRKTSTCPGRLNVT